MTALHPAAARGFETGAPAYERARPGYPAEAVRYLFDRLGVTSRSVVVDVGAGTGKFTRYLLEEAAAVIAVEPVAGMRDALRRGTGVEALDGRAESIPLGDASADAVVVAQAFHWFDGDVALAEIHRVLRADGGLGLVWNVRDDTVAWSAALTAILDRYAGDTPRYRDGRWRAAFDRTDLFGPLEQRSFAYAPELRRADLLDRVRSISFVAAAEPTLRDRILDAVAALLDAEPELADRDPIRFPYRTDVFVTRRR